MHTIDDLRSYRKSRRLFALRTYILLFVWLVLALIQWVIVCHLQYFRSELQDLYYVSIATFVPAVLIFLLFIFIDKLRFTKCLNIVIAFVIVELQIVALFALITRTWIFEMLTFFFVCVLLVVLFLVIGAILPKKVDLTLDIAMLFIFAFILLIVAVFFLMFHLIIPKSHSYSFFVVQLAITVTILMFVMYHAQTIHGSRFAEMRLRDFILGSLILFHDFLIIYWLTFYYQAHYRPITPDKYITNGTTVDIGPKRAYELRVYNDDASNYYLDVPRAYQSGNGHKDHVKKASADIWTNDQNWTNRVRDRSRDTGSDGNGNRDVDRSREGYADGDRSRESDQNWRPDSRESRQSNTRDYGPQDGFFFTTKIQLYKDGHLDRPTHGREAYRNPPNGDDSQIKAKGSRNEQDSLEDSASELPRYSASVKGSTEPLKE